MSDELDKLSRLTQVTDKAKSITSALGMKSGYIATAVVDAAAQAAIQTKYAVISEKEYRGREHPDFRKAFADLYPRLPKIDKPTRIGLVCIEDGNYSDTSKNHGRLVSATTGATWHRLTGEEHMPGMLVNRMPYEDAIGNKRRPLLDEAMPDRFARDLAQPYLKSLYHAPSYTLYNTSTVHYNKDITTPEKRLESIREIDAYFGPNALYVLSSGNARDRELSRYHNALRYHPSTLIIGACQMHDAKDHQGKILCKTQPLEQYSSYGCDVVYNTLPHGANYRYMPWSKPDEYTHQDGTSFSSPQALASLGVLVQRFARSKENPTAVLAKEDIILALKNTAEPIHVQKSDFSEDNHLLPFTKIGNRYVSKYVGNGRANIQEAWKLLEEMEKSVASGASFTNKRQHVRKQMADVDKVQSSPDKLYYYRLPINTDLHADSIIIDIKSKEFSAISGDSLIGRMDLVSPSGIKLELTPSISKENGYFIAKAVGLQGEKIDGTWTLVSTSKLDDVVFNFDNAMPPGHVGITVRPDEKQHIKGLYANTNFSFVPCCELDERFIKRSSSGDREIARHDFSNTLFPKLYAELRLVQMLEQKDKKSAQAFLDSGYNGFIVPKAILAEAIKKEDSGLIIAEFAKTDKERFAVLKSIANLESEDSLCLLAKHGYANLIDPVTHEHALSVVITAAERKLQRFDVDYKYDSLHAFVNELHKQNVDVALISHPDGRNIVHTINNNGLRTELFTALDRHQDKKFNHALNDTLQSWGLDMQHTAPKKELLAIKDKLQRNGVSFGLPIGLGPLPELQPGPVQEKLRQR